MSPDLQSYSEAIRVLCERYGVRRLELFGSAARDDFDAEASDVDLLVEFRDQGWQGSFKRYMGLKLGLEDLFDRSVDLVELDTANNPYFLTHIAKDRRPVYAA